MIFPLVVILTFWVVSAATVPASIKGSVAVQDGNSQPSVRKWDPIVGCRICFQETEGSSQCQGTRASCSGYSHLGSEWTLPFRDDTDNRDGGCTYQWKIDCV